MAINYAYKPYEEDEETRRRRAALEAAEASKPAAYSGSYASAVDEALRRIQNREKFSYDMNADALYQQYKDSYTRQGKLAMEDTFGKAASQTGGYGNSYAQTAGQQTYQAYLDKLNDRIPELYAAAYDRYRKEGEDLKDEYAMLSARDQQEYARHRDAVDDYYKDISYRRQAYGDAYDRGYGRYSDEQNRLYQLALEAQEQANTDRAFAESKRQYEESKEASAAKLAEGARQADLDYEVAMAKLKANNKGTAGAGDVYETDTTGEDNTGIPNVGGTITDPTDDADYTHYKDEGEWFEALDILNRYCENDDDFMEIAKNDGIPTYFVDVKVMNQNGIKGVRQPVHRKLLNYIEGLKTNNVSKTYDYETTGKKLLDAMESYKVPETAQEWYLNRLAAIYSQKDITSSLAKMKGKTTGKAISGAKDNYLQGSFDDRLRY